MVFGSVELHLKLADTAVTGKLGAFPVREEACEAWPRAAAATGLVPRARQAVRYSPVSTASMRASSARLKGRASAAACTCSSTSATVVQGSTTRSVRSESR